MIETLALTFAQLMILSALGYAVLAPLNPDIRRRLVPAAPVFGAALIAVLTNWTNRWISITWSLPLVVVAAVCLYAYAVKTQKRPFQFGRIKVRTMSFAGLIVLPGIIMISIPIATVGDTNAVAPSQYFDQFYFAGVSTYIVDHPILPGPVTDASQGPLDAATAAPAADIVDKRLRFGQSSVAAMLSVAVFKSPFETVTSTGLLLFLMLTPAVVVAGQLIGLSRRSAAIAAALVSTSFFVVSQPLDGRHDGLLGASMALLAVALTVAVSRERGLTWPLVLMAGSLVTVYSEYLLIVGVMVAGYCLVGPRQTLLPRFDRIAGRWALSFVLVPWAWIWLAQSFKTTTRFTSGASPFEEKHGWALFRAFAGVPSFDRWDWLNPVMSLCAVAVLLVACAGLGLVALKVPELSGLAIGLLPVFAFIQVKAVASGATYLQDRVMQLCMPLLILLIIAGLTLSAPRLAITRRPSILHGARRRVAISRLPRAGAAIFVACNLLALGLTTSPARASVQHVPVAFTDAVADLVERHGPENVTVVAPNLTDAASLSLSLSKFPGIDQAALPFVPTFLGTASRWDRLTSKYYVVGRGVSVLGGHRTIAADGDYRIVTLDQTGLIISPVEATNWPRLLWRRGYTCARDGVRVLAIRGGSQPGELPVEIRSASSTPTTLQLVTSDGKLLPALAPAKTVGDRVERVFAAPRQPQTVLALRLSGTGTASDRGAFPVTFSDARDPRTARTAGEKQLDGFCLRDRDDGTDGYDQDLASFRTAF